MRSERFNGIASKRRDATVEENLKQFDEMKAGTPEGLRWCIRAKISVDDPNKALRDPVIYRCNPLPHHRTGYVQVHRKEMSLKNFYSSTKWKIYPTYDFACPIVDSIEGVTHALRTNEYRDRNPQYHWMTDAVGLRKVNVWDYRWALFFPCLSLSKGLIWSNAVASISFTLCYRKGSFVGS